MNGPLSDVFLFPRIEVAIKEGSSSNAKEEMLEEAKAMIRVAKHDHIVNFLGISMDGEKVYVLLEFCSFGSIDSFLEKNSENFRTKMECGNYKEVVSWFVQVADAMDFLVKNNIIHVSTLGLRLGNNTSTNESSFLRYLFLIWPVRQLRAVVVQNLSLSQNKPIR